MADNVPTHLDRPYLRRRIQGPWILIVGFALLILLGTFVLRLPWMSAGDKPVTWSDAFFTAASAITVTGLTVRDTAQDFSFAGQIAILILLQIGGVGFITSSVILFRLIGRRVTLGTRFLVQQDVGTGQLSGVGRLATYVLIITVAFETVGAILLWVRWSTVYPPGEALWYAIFQSISTYCNAGFDLFGATDQGALYGFAGDWFSLLVLSLLVIAGGFGIAIYYDLIASWRTRMFSLNTRFSLTLAAGLIVGGLVFILLDPILHSQVLSERTYAERFWMGLFTSISARTAGVTIVPIDRLGDATQLVLVMLMFIGAAPASMAGGVSTSTIAVLLTAVSGTARGREAAVFGRTLPVETVAKAVAISTVSLLVIMVVTLMLTLYYQTGLVELGFEVVSAYSNTGYSLGLTSDLDNFGRFVIAFTMFWGRLGPLTIVVALAQREHPTLIRYPEEPVILG
jgi:trk system potassium uptake protein TrkH